MWPTPSLPEIDTASLPSLPIPTLPSIPLAPSLPEMDTPSLPATPSLPGTPMEFKPLRSLSRLITTLPSLVIVLMLDAL